MNNPYYKIEITLFEDKQVEERNYVDVEPYVDEDGENRTMDYRNETKTKEVERQLYTQVVQSLDLKSVIDAVNNPVEKARITRAENGQDRKA